MCLQQFPKNTNVAFNTDVSGFDVLLHAPPRWRYTIVTSVLRHRHTYARKLLRELYTIRSAKNFGIRSV